MPELDLEFVRSQFPAFSEPSLANWAFFENAGGSYASKFVINRLTRFYRQRKMQPYGPAGPTRDGGAEMDEARTRLAAMLNVETDEVSFGPSTTQNVYVLAQAFRQYLQTGDAVIVTDQDHEANSGQWRQLAEAGIEVREWKLDPETGSLNITDLAALLDSRVRLVAFPHCSNIVGEVNPVADICAMARAVGAATCVDGVSYAPHGLPDVDALGADVYMFSSYKTFGPHQGIMVVRRHLADRLPNQGHYFNGANRAARFTPAGPDHAQIAAAAGMADYVDALYAHHFADDVAASLRAAAVHDLQSESEKRVLTPLLGYLRGRNDIRLIGPDTGPNKVPTVALSHRRRGADLAEELSKKGIIAGGGDFYANRCLSALGLDPDHGVLRLSFVHYTTPAEVSHLIEALDETL